jgi:acyl carrier protein
MLNQDLAAFIEKQLVADGRTKISETTPLIEEGIVDSMGLMQIVTFIEERTGLRISDDDVTPDNFETVAAIGRLVEQIESRRGRR